MQVRQHLHDGARAVAVLRVWVRTFVLRKSQLAATLCVECVSELGGDARWACIGVVRLRGLSHLRTSLSSLHVPVKRHRGEPGHSGHAGAQRHTDHTDEPHNHPNPPTTHTPHVSATTETAADSTAAGPVQFSEDKYVSTLGRSSPPTPFHHSWLPEHIR